MPIRKRFCCALLALLGACDRQADVDPPPTSSMSFRYSALGRRPPGTYRAVGEVDLRVRGVQPGDLAYGSMSAHVPPRVHVQSVRNHRDGRQGFDGAEVYLPSGVRTGQTLPFREQCEASPACAGMIIELGLYPNVGFPEVGCTMTSGSVHLARVSAERVTGTFTGTAACDGFQSGPMQVERGSFDVAMVELPDG